MTEEEFNELVYMHIGQDSLIHVWEEERDKTIDFIVSIIRPTEEE